MIQKIIIETSRNFTPEDAVNEAIEPLFAEGYRIVSAATALAPYGEMADAQGDEHARHVYYVTTVVLEKP